MASEHSTCKQTKPARSGEKFVNPWNKWPFSMVSGPYRFIKWIKSMAATSHYRPNLDNDLPIMKPYFLENNDKTCEKSNKILVTWLGHASILLEIDGFNILCDPIFSTACPPIVGPRRYRDVPCEVEDLPDIDAVLLSHNHYDHMDSATLKKLYDKNNKIHFLIPLGDKYNLKQMLGEGYIIYKEMNWYDKYVLKKLDSDRKLEIYFTPSQHWSNRGVFDLFKSLWGSWTIIGPEHRFWFGGDTGYCEAFKEIGDNFGPFHGAAIPIGAYKPRDLTKFQHVDPEEALLIHKDIKSNVSFGIHWGTFQLTAENYMEPKEILDKLVKEENDSNEKQTNFFTLNHGETLQIIGEKFEKLACEKIKKIEKARTERIVTVLFNWFLSIIGYVHSFYSVGNSCESNDIQLNKKNRTPSFNGMIRN